MRSRRRTSRDLLKSRPALATLKRQCDQMAEQESDSERYHTLYAVDPDVIYMAAFPLHSLALGSVFHAWEPLRKLSLRVASSSDATERRTAIEDIFELDAARIPLLTTIALSEYLFRWRVPDEVRRGYLVLPPHAIEWRRARKRATDDARRYALEVLPKYVHPERIERLVEGETEPHRLSQRLLEVMPETVSVLFPAQLRSDYAHNTLFEFWSKDVVFEYEKLPKSIPRFDEVLGTREAVRINKGVEQFLREDAQQSPTHRLSDRASGVRGDITRRIASDAQALTWLYQLNANPSNRTTIVVDGEERQLRVILLTASAKLWRAGRHFGLDATCLRNPIAYLGVGHFYEWALRGLVTDDDPLYRELRHGKLSDWLELLLSSSSEVAHERDTAQYYIACVNDWERLMSHLATSLNLTSPRSGLHNAISVVASRHGERSLISELTSMLWGKVIDTTLRISDSASVAGLRGITDDALPKRNLPPVVLPEREDVERILAYLHSEDCNDRTSRHKLIEDIVNLSVSESDTVDPKAAKSYLKAILMSLLWFRLGKWTAAREVISSAVGFALARDVVNDASEWTLEAVTGEEALFLLAVATRLTARSSEELAEARTALTKAVEIDSRLQNSVRIAAEEESLGVAEALYSTQASDRHGPLAVMFFELMVDSFDAEPWKQMRERWQGPGMEFLSSERSAAIYELSYSLQQWYCAILMRFMMAVPPAQKSGARVGREQKVVADEVWREFEKFSAFCEQAWKKGYRCSRRSETSEQISAAYRCWTDPGARTKNEGQRLARCFARAATSDSGLSRLDTVRLLWIQRRLNESGLTTVTLRSSPDASI